LGTDLSVFSQAELDAIAIRLNSRPRKTLGFATPDEVFSGLVNKAANAVTSRNAGGVRYGIPDSRVFGAGEAERRSVHGGFGRRPWAWKKR
jgi:hypothetical protein